MIPRSSQFIGWVIGTLVLVPVCASVACTITVGSGRSAPATPPARPRARAVTVDDDGPADHRSINEAIRAAPANSIVSVRPGTYHEFLELRSGVAIVGAGRENTTVEYLRGDAVVRGDHVSGVRIQGLRLQHETGQAPCGSPVIMLRTSQNIVIEDNEILGSGYEGIILDDVTGARITNNRIAENSAAGVEILRSTSVTMTRNELANLAVDLAVAGSTVRVEDCTFAGTTLSVVTMPIAGHPTDVQISRSRFAATARDVMARTGDNHLRLQNNACAVEPFLERRELRTPQDGDVWVESTLQDPMHADLLSLTYPQPADAASRLAALRTCTGEAYTAPPAPVAPTSPTSPMINLRIGGRWVGGFEGSMYELDIGVRGDNRLDARLVVEDAMRVECVGQDQGPDGTGRRIHFDCADDEEGAVQYDMDCVISFDGSRPVARDASEGAGCTLARVALARG